MFVLSERFGPNLASLQAFSKRLGFNLVPSANPHVSPASRLKAIATGKTDVADAKRHLSAMQPQLSAVIKRLPSLSLDDIFEDLSDAPAYLDMMKQLETGLAALSEGQGALERLVEQPGTLVRWEPIDRRELKDRRRDKVLGAVFQCRVDAGRKVAFTTDPVTSKRSGELVYFAQAVCACLTDPPTEIKAETIVNKIREKGKSYRPMAEWDL